MKYLQSLLAEQYLNKGRLDNTSFNISSRIIFQAFCKTIFPPTHINLLIYKFKIKEQRKEKITRQFLSQRLKDKKERRDEQKLLHPNQKDRNATASKGFNIASSNY